MKVFVYPAVLDFLLGSTGVTCLVDCAGFISMDITSEGSDVFGSSDTVCGVSGVTVFVGASGAVGTLGFTDFVSEGVLFFA